MPPHVQDGGLWINLGPLLYHWADSHLYLTGEDLSIEVQHVWYTQQARSVATVVASSPL